MQEFKISSKDLGSMALPDFCPRCFWIKYQIPSDKIPFKIPMPGIFQHIDGYVKDIVHKYVEQKGTLPPWYPQIGKVKEIVSTSDLHWRNFQVKVNNTNLTIWGTPDEILLLDNDEYHIYDYKTAKFTGTQDSLYPEYEVQLNCYAYISENKNQPFKPVTHLALLYLEPQTDIPIEDLSKLNSEGFYFLKFKTNELKVDIKPQLVEELANKAVHILSNSIPLNNPNCANCRNTENFLEVLQGKRKEQLTERQIRLLYAKKSNQLKRQGIKFQFGEVEKIVDKEIKEIFNVDDIKKLNREQFEKLLAEYEG